MTTIVKTFLIQIPCNNYDYSDYRIHGTQNVRLEPSVSTQKLIFYPEILAKMYLGCSEISATGKKIRPQKMKMVLRKMFISSKAMHRYC